MCALLVSPGPLLSAPQLPWAANFALQHSLVPMLLYLTAGMPQGCWTIMDRILWNLSQNKLSFFIAGLAHKLWKLTVTQILLENKAEFHDPVPKTSTMMPLLQWCGSHGNYHAHPPEQMLARIIDTAAFITIPAPKKGLLVRTRQENAIERRVWATEGILHLTYVSSTNFTLNKKF